MSWRRRSRLRVALVPYVSPLASLVAGLVGWQLLVLVAQPPTYLLPSPRLVAIELALRTNLLFWHAMVTAQETALGFLLSVAIGIPVAMAVVAWRWLELAIYPLLVTSQAVPKVAIAPLLLVWLGFGLTPKIVVVVLIAFFPIVIDTVVGLKSVPMEMTQLGRSMGLSSSRMFCKIRLPYALPYMFAGLKVAATLSVVGAVVGEFVGADRGLGYLLVYAAGQLNTTLVFATLVPLVLLGVLSFAAIQGLERWLIPWHVSVRLNHTIPARG